MRRFSTSASRAIFDRPLKARQRLKTASLPNHQYYEYLRDEMTSRLIDRIEDINRPFPTSLDLGCHSGLFGKKIAEGDSLRSSSGGIGGIEKLVEADISLIGTAPTSTENREKSVDDLFKNSGSNNNKVKLARVAMDDEKIDFASDSFDLVVSNGNIHWINDIPSILQQIQRILKPDGAFIATMLGGSTLQELRHCFYLADQERKGGTSQHASPMALASDMAALMQAANFALPTVDVDTIQIGYPDLFTLMEHLYRMGESSASYHRSVSVGKDTMIAAAAIYDELYGLEDGTIPATFEIINMIGWKPHSSQPKACRRGSGEVSLKDIKKMQ